MTLLFADVHGSTELIQHLEPEGVADLLGPLLRDVAEIVSRYEGISVSLGDGIMALFGPPLLAEKHAVRACLAALDILDLVARQGDTLRVRLGIHVGDVMVHVGSDGRPELGQLYGAPIHVAARLEQTSEPSTASLSSSVYELVRDSIDATPLPPIKVKGIDKPVERMLLLSRRASEPSWLRQSSGLTGFVGRERELAILEAASDSSGASAPVIQICGEPGIGKSRLLQEFAAGKIRHGWYCAPLVGDRLRRRIPFHTIGQWFQEVLGISGDDLRRAENQRDRLKHATGMSDLRLHVLYRALGIEALGNEGHAATGDPSSSMAEPIACLLRHASQGRKLLLVCEDLDMFDSASAQLLPSILVALAGQPLYVVASSRKKTPKEVWGSTPIRYIHLGPLGDDAAGSLLSTLWKPSSALLADVASTVLDRAGGNPLFIEEITAFARQGNGDLKQSSYWNEALSTNRIPDRVETLIVDRLAQLSDERRQILRLASVLGYSFTVDLLGQLTNLSDAALDRPLAKLQAEHLLIAIDGDSRQSFRFRHALTRDVAYRSLLRAQREEAHTRLVGIIERQEGRDAAHRLEELCYHSSGARLDEKAVVYLQEAAGVAADRGVSKHSIDYLQQALGVAGRLPDQDRSRRARVDILLGLRTIAVLELRYLDALFLLDQAERVATELDDLILTLTVRARRMRPLNALGRLMEAIAIGEEIKAASQAADTWPLAVEVSHDLGQAYFEVGDFIRAEAVFHEVRDQLSCFQSAPTVRGGNLTVTIPATRAAALVFLGRFCEASEELEAALHSASLSRRPYDLVYSQFMQGFFHLFKFELVEAVARFETTLALAESHGVRALIPSLQCGLGHALLLYGAADQAVLKRASDLLVAARDTATSRRREIIRLWATTALAMAMFRSGNINALQLAAEAVDLAKMLGMNGFLVVALRFQGLILMADRSRREHGLRCVLQSLSLARRLQMTAEAAHSLIASDCIRPTSNEARLRLASGILERAGLYRPQQCIAVWQAMSIPP